MLSGRREDCRVFGTQPWPDRGSKHDGSSHVSLFDAKRRGHRRRGRCTVTWAQKICPIWIPDQVTSSLYIRSMYVKYVAESDLQKCFRSEFDGSSRHVQEFLASNLFPMLAKIAVIMSVIYDFFKASRKLKSEEQKRRGEPPEAWSTDLLDTTLLGLTRHTLFLSLWLSQVESSLAKKSQAFNIWDDKCAENVN